MERWTRWVGILGLLMIAAPAMAEPEMAKLEEKLQAAKAAYRELLETPDRSVPAALLENCRAIAVIPSAIKGALGYGARYGQGVISARDADGKWSPPSFIKLTGGSVGFQIGAEKSDVVLFFMTDKSLRSLLDSKFTLGGKVSVAAGPAGRSAEASTDLKLDAEIYSYAKSKGLFAGISLEGARLAPDRSANQVFYGGPIDPKTLLLDHRSPRLPDAAKEFIATLP
jgi:lipid-binding SYLF domain-containing protein